MVITVIAFCIIYYNNKIDSNCKINNFCLQLKGFHGSNNLWPNSKSPEIYYKELTGPRALQPLKLRTQPQTPPNHYVNESEWQWLRLTAPHSKTHSKPCMSGLMSSDSCVNTSTYGTVYLMKFSWDRCTLKVCIYIREVKIKCIKHIIYFETLFFNPHAPFFFPSVTHYEWA